jgi:type VI secretion system secreted protein VgrG
MLIRPRPLVCSPVSTATPGAWSQQTRLLRIHSALGPDKLLVESLTGREAIDEGFRITVDVLSTDALIELKSLNGQPVLVELLTQLSRSDYRPFHGHVTSAALLGSDGGFARYRLTIEPWFAFLAHRRDSFIFQGMSVPQIIDEVLGDYVGEGKLVPDWRWELKESAAYKPRSLTTQYEETDLDFIRRLLAEEGLFYWFEHKGDSSAAPFGTHTLVIADHNGAFKANAQAQVKYKRADATESEDTFQRISGARRIMTNAVEMASWDYRSVQPRPVAAQSGRNNSQESFDLTAVDHPGLYAYQDGADGSRYAHQQLEALEARNKLYQIAGTLRTAAPGTTTTVVEHPEFSGGGDDSKLALIAVDHYANNNVSADHKAGIDSLFAPATKEEGPLYRCRIEALRVAIPWRPLAEDGHGLRIHPKPTASGTQTAIVVGQSGAPLTAERDHRIKVQFHWQRGDKSHNTQSHPKGANAPANETAGTWVRIMSQQAGANWGSNFVPRIGQEVLIAFLENDIDRPVIVGAAYNGRGEQNSQANGTGATVGATTANAPAWFPGAAGSGQSTADVENHAHQAVFSGFKTQALATSQSGQGGYNALVFDDTPNQAGTRLTTTQFTTALNLGRLKQQTDNQRQVNRGHGAELVTDAYGSVRAGSGLLLSADARANASSTQIDSREAIAQLAQAKELAKTLADTSQKHNAKLEGEAAPDKLPTIEQMGKSEEALKATDNRGGQGQSSGGEFAATGGGTGTVPAWTSPMLTLSAPAGISFFTPMDAVMSAGQTLALSSGQDVNLVAQDNTALAVKGGIVLFTYGKASNGGKPNQETGIKLHAGSGSVSMQSQSDETKVTADKKITFASTTKTLQVAAPNHILMTAGGAYLKLEGGNIQLHAPGSVELHASQKNLTGAASASASLTLPQPSRLKIPDDSHYPFSS